MNTCYFQKKFYQYCAPLLLPIATHDQLNAIRGGLLKHAESIIEIQQRLHSASHKPNAEDLQALEHAAREIATLLQVVAVAG